MILSRVMNEISQEMNFPLFSFYSGAHVAAVGQNLFYFKTTKCSILDVSILESNLEREIRANKLDIYF